MKTWSIWNNSNVEGSLIMPTGIRIIYQTLYKRLDTAVLAVQIQIETASVEERMLLFSLADGFKPKTYVGVPAIVLNPDGTKVGCVRAGFEVDGTCRMFGISNIPAGIARPSLFVECSVVYQI